jgi:bacillithiol system protein YtxJ
MPNIPRIHDLAEWERLLERSRSEGILVFKHSTACPTSAAALAELERFLGESAGEAPGAVLVRVIEERPISKEIERRLGVRHESPQAIWLEGGAARGAISHEAITAETLRDGRWRDSLRASPTK